MRYKLPVKVVITKNNSLGMIKWEQMVFLGNPEYGCDLQPTDFAAFARACGATGFTIEDPKTCGDTLDQALASAGPVIVDAVVDRRCHRRSLPNRWTACAVTRKGRAEPRQDRADRTRRQSA